MSHDTSYYRERADAERAMALAAQDQKVRGIHEELARRYEALAGEADLPLPASQASGSEDESASAEGSEAELPSPSTLSSGVGRIG